MLLQATNALRIGLLNALSVDKFVPKMELVEKAGDVFLEFAHRIARNATGGALYTPRMLGHLELNERLRYGSWDFLAYFLPRDPTVVFAGAHAGAVLKTVYDTWPESTIYGFEADPYLFPFLKANVENLPRVNVTHAALHSSDGQSIKLQTRDGIGSQSTLYELTELFNSTWPTIDWGTKRSVRTVALSPWARRHGVERVDFIYLDVECAEMDVLRGAREFLRNVSVLHLEVSTVPLCEGTALWPDVERYIRFWGFRPLILPARPWDVHLDISAIRVQGKN